jgi:hypothetical protein
MDSSETSLNRPAIEGTKKIGWFRGVAGFVRLPQIAKNC